MAYGESPTSTNVDGVRLLVGDISTSTASELLQDADYTFFLTQGSFYIACQLAANSLAAKFASIAEGVKRKEVGDLKIEYSDAKGAADDYSELSKKFQRMAAAQISPYAGGITHSGKTTDRLDTDLVQPSFRRGLMDNPAVLAFTGRGSS